MNSYLTQQLLARFKADSITSYEQIQSLWSGYGELVRVGMSGSEVKSVIVKHIQLPESELHPKGWNTALSHQRKLKSYQVEVNWYSSYAKLAKPECPIPACYWVEQKGSEIILVLEDLKFSGYPITQSMVDPVEFKTCISWLAHFHAAFMGTESDKLWDIGTYWHLKTRPEELENLTDYALKDAASNIDKTLNGCPIQTLVHGDAKVANFCFSESGAQVAAVDFQYVGRGCGMKDIAYFVGSCLSDSKCEQQEQTILDYYFSELKKALDLYNKQEQSRGVEEVWRPLYRVAWADFHRFLKGWSPGHWKINDYSERLCSQVIASISRGNH